MGDALDIKAGDEVRVFDSNGARCGQPAGGWSGTVEKVGRKLVHIRVRNATEVFRLDTGHKNDDYMHRWFRTLEQAAIDQRRAEALLLLSEAAIRMDYGRRLTDDQVLELAAVVKAWGRA